jgi:RNA polymerase sigma factor (sigma-70 family)
MIEPLDDYIERIRPAVERYVGSHIRDRDDSAEVTSYVFLAITRSWANFRGDCPPEAYAVRVAANAVKNYFTRIKTKHSLEFSLGEWIESFQLQQTVRDVGPYQQLESAEWVATLISEMEACCSPMEQGVVKMFYQGMSLDDIAKLTGMNASSVRSHFLRARKKLLAHLLVANPELLGGREIVLQTAKRLAVAEPNLLSKEESAALFDSSCKETNEHLRSAMLKLAQHLGGIG